MNAYRMTLNKSLDRQYLRIAAVMVGRIATGEITEELKPKSGRTKSGKAGAMARARDLSSEERSQIAKKAARARWEP